MSSRGGSPLPALLLYHPNIPVNPTHSQTHILQTQNLAHARWISKHPTSPPGSAASVGRLRIPSPRVQPQGALAGQPTPHSALRTPHSALHPTQNYPKVYISRNPPKLMSHFHPKMHLTI